MSAPSERSRALDGILLMALTFTIFPLMDGVGKYLTTDYHPFQIIWGRYFFQAVCVSMIVFTRRPVSILRVRKPSLQFARAFAGWASNVPFIFALALIPLADAFAALMVGPLIVTALSVPMLREQVGMRRWCAIAVGMVGALIVVRPGMGVMHWAISLPLLTALCFALFQIFTRKLAGRDDNDTTLLMGAYAGTLFSTILLPFVWKTPDLMGWVLLAAQGVLISAAHLTLVRAFQFAAASVLAPFAYVQILSATVVGLLVFGDFPDHWTIVGAAIICASGLYIVHRERVRAR